jgi:ribosome-binding factor A
MDAQRQKKVSALIQKELAALIAADLRRGAANLLISVTTVRVAPDFSVAKIYLSIFPSDKANERLEQLQKNSSKIKFDLSKIVKNQLRKVPALSFYLDDSLDHIDEIDDSIKNPFNPIKK